MQLPRFNVTENLLKLSPSIEDADRMFLSLRGLCKTFGETKANDEISFDINSGEIIGLVGANGAGKSTLIRSISALVRPDKGDLIFGGISSTGGAYSRTDAQERGIRTVFQELSLAPNLSAAENFVVEYSESAGRRWRGSMREMAASTLLTIFPNAKIDLDCPVEELPLAERQMIEIARAACDPRLRLLILDEPTSSLDSLQSQALRTYVRRRASEGVAFLFVTHKLEEVIASTDRVVVLKNGRVVWKGPTNLSGIAHLVQEMGATVSQPDRARHARVLDCATEVIKFSQNSQMNALDTEISIGRGQVVGLAGLEGNGQSKLLREILRQTRHGGDLLPDPRPKASFVTGDRASEGIFPGLSVLKNATISLVATMRPFSLISSGADLTAARSLLNQLGIAGSRLSTNIVEMSGGNQQKALMVRPLLVGADIILLDDPTRGVDVQTKHQIYDLIHQAAEAGKTVIWYSSEDLEFQQCDRVFVLHENMIVKELVGEHIEESAILDAAFSQMITQRSHAGSSHRSMWLSIYRTLLPFAALAAIYGAIICLNPTAASGLGVELLLTSAINLVFIALGQMFIVNGAQIDLGSGAFAALISVTAATLLPEMPVLGIAAIVGFLCVYVCLGAAVVINKLPSLVVTLGASFIWLGIGHTMLPTPGGTSPDWLSYAFSVELPFIPTPVALILLPTLLAWGISRSKLGVIMRGFGRNPRAMSDSGWSSLKIQISRYSIAGAFILVGGLSMTGLNGAADANSGSSMTLLSIATVVIGGCSLSGGILRAFSVAAGAVTLSLVGTLLGGLGLSTNYTAAVQGSLLILLLLVQVFERKASK
jgi:ribose transport system ATP-binding protein